MALLHRCLEWWQVNLVEGAFVNLYVDRAPLVLLVIDKVVLDAGLDPVRLDRLNLRDHQSHLQ